jgi:His/Glu/Gln/Arg/opine family amino acid ABC transporter permease subunit
MLEYDWNFGVLVPYVGAFGRATLVTLTLSIASFLIGTVTGVVIAIVLHPMRHTKLIYFLNDCIRAIPVLVLLFIVYFFPLKELAGLEPLSSFWAAVLAFALSQAAYTLDIVRVSIDQVPRSTIQAGLAIGLSRHDLWRYVMVPDLVRQTAPAQLAFFIGIVRLSSLASVIGCQEVVYVSRVISAQTFRSFEPWLLVAALYILLVLPFTLVAREMERSKWLKRRG